MCLHYHLSDRGFYIRGAPLAQKSPDAAVRSGAERSGADRSGAYNKLTKESFLEKKKKVNTSTWV